MRKCVDCGAGIRPQSTRCKMCAYAWRRQQPLPACDVSPRAMRSKARYAALDPLARAERNKRSYEWRRAHPDAAREHQRKHKLRSQFGVTIEQYWQMMLQQAGVCAICGKSETSMRAGKLKQLAVDHNHDTGRVRALLCAQCNVGLGSFRDSADLIDLAIAYLEGHKG